MNTLTKLAASSAFALSFALSAATPAMAGGDEPIVVQSKAAMEQWQKQTTRDLNRTLAFSPTSGKLRADNGIVQISFTLGADGKAENIELYDRSANLTAVRIAKRAVRKLGTLDEVPVKNRAQARFLASIIFADNADIHERLAAKLKKSERTRMASADVDGEYISIGI